MRHEFKNPGISLSVAITLPSWVCCAEIMLKRNFEKLVKNISHKEHLPLTFYLQIKIYRHSCYVG